MTTRAEEIEARIRLLGEEITANEQENMQMEDEISDLEDKLEKLNKDQ